MTALHRLVVAAVALVATLSALPSVGADRWRLDGAASVVAFTTIKNGRVAEGHLFKELRGGVDDAGSAEVVLALASVDTLIPIRDERMRDLLFEVAQFPEARLRAVVDLKELESMPAGESKATTLTADLDLHGRSAPLTVELTVTRITDDRLLVATRRPLMVTAAAFDLEAGIEKLRAAAALESITPVVPVSVQLWFDRVD